MTANHKPEDGWETTTWKGHRLAQHRAFQALPFAKKLESIEQMADFARAILAERIRKGLPYVDPLTQQRVPATDSEPSAVEKSSPSGSERKSTPEDKSPSG